MPSMDAVEIGDGYRGADGRLGYLLRQVVHAFHGEMERVLRPFELSSPQYGALYVLDQESPISGAHLARAMGVTPQAASLLVNGMRRDGLVDRRPHPTHGRVLEVRATALGRKRFRAAQPAITALEERLSGGLGARDLALVRRWMVDATIALST